MPYVLFHGRFPEIAERETRTVTVLEDASLELPPGDYSLLEMFCDEPDCDCRRVFFHVVSSRKEDVEAVIAYGWESPEFYAGWMHDDDPEMIRALQGPVLNMGSPESELAPAILNMVQNVVLQDTAYVERVKAHYRMFREKIESEAESPPDPPASRRDGPIGMITSGPFPRLVTVPQAPATSMGKANRNAPCPCGSGKKYKKCCMERA